MQWALLVIVVESTARYAVYIFLFTISFNITGFLYDCYFCILLMLFLLKGFTFDSDVFAFLMKCFDFLKEIEIIIYNMTAILICAVLNTAKLLSCFNILLHRLVFLWRKHVVVSFYGTYYKAQTVYFVIIPFGVTSVQCVVLLPSTTYFCVDTMTNVMKIIPYNCRGFNNPIKMKCISNMLTKERPGVVFLQETHQKRILPKILKSSWFEHHFQAPGSSKARGVAIVFSKNIQLQNPKVIADPRGRYIFFNCSTEEHPFTFASIYAPNSNQLQFLIDTFTALCSFKMGDLLIGGDFNLINNPLLDKMYTSIQMGKLNKRKRPKLDSLFLSFNVTDIWRQLNPTTRSYTYYSPLHRTNSRIDYILCSTSLFHCWESAEIEPILISDHSMVSRLDF